MSGFADGEVDCQRCHESVDRHTANRDIHGTIVGWICPPPAGGPSKHEAPE